jgi:hypothetical protein
MVPGAVPGMSDMKATVDKQVLVWAINKVGFVDSFTGEALDVRNAVTFEANSKLYVMTGENWDKVQEMLHAKWTLTDIIDGRTL